MYTTNSRRFYAESSCESPATHLPRVTWNCLGKCADSIESAIERRNGFTAVAGWRYLLGECARERDSKEREATSGSRI